MKWLIILVTLAGCTTDLPTYIVPHAHHVQPDPIAAEARAVSNEVVRHALSDSAPPEQVDHMTDLTIAMQRAARRAKQHPTHANKNAAHGSIKALREFMKGTP